jgi:hypothetical protein
LIINVFFLTFENTHTIKITVHKDPKTNFFMVLNHKYDAQKNIYQNCKFLKSLFVEILRNLHFM